MKNHTLATVTVAVLLAGCGSSDGNRTKTKFPAITADGTPFIRITEIAYWDLRRVAIRKEPTPITAVVESIIQRQRVVGTTTLDEGDLYIPALTDWKEPKSILTVNSGVEEWALVRTAVWDESRKKFVVVPGFIPFFEYQRHLASLQGKRNDNRHSKP